MVQEPLCAPETLERGQPGSVLTPATEKNEEDVLCHPGTIQQHFSTVALQIELQQLCSRSAAEQQEPLLQSCALAVALLRGAEGIAATEEGIAEL